MFLKKHTPPPPREPATTRLMKAITAFRYATGENPTRIDVGEDVGRDLVDFAREVCEVPADESGVTGIWFDGAELVVGDVGPTAIKVR